MGIFTITQQPNDLDVFLYPESCLTKSDDLSFKDDDYVDGTYYHPWGDGDFIYVACFGFGIRAYSFDGTTLTLEATQDDGGDYVAIWCDDDYIYVANGNTGIRAYTFDGAAFTLVDTQDDGNDYYGVWGDGNYLYVSCKGDGIRAYTFLSENFVLKDTQDDGGDYYEAWGDGTYIYVACGGDGIRAYTFDGTNFILVQTQDDGGVYYGIDGGNGYIYAACGADGIRAYTFDGVNFTLVDTQDDGAGDYTDVRYINPERIAATCSGDGTRLYSFINNNFTLLDTDDQGGAASPWGLWHYGDYLYVGAQAGGLQAYDLGGCCDFTAFGAATNPECVDDPENNPDDDTSYVYNDTISLLFDLYGLPDQNLSGTINYVQVYARTKSHQYAQDVNGIFKILLNPEGVCTDLYASDDFNLITSYNTYNQVWRENPATSVDWSWDDMDILVIGTESSSPTATGVQKTLTLRPDAAGSVTQCTPKGQVNNYDCVNELVQNGFTDYVQADASGSSERDLYNLPNHTTETGVITSVAVFAIVRPLDHSDTSWARTLIRTQATEYEGDEETNLPYCWGCSQNRIVTEYAINPNTLIAWTWADIDALEAGIKMEGFDATHPMMCTQVYVVVYYEEDTNPEIRTTQCYAKINYSPPTDSCYLNKPNKISTKHGMNIKMINFWSGNREVYSLNRSGKSMVLTGTEFYNPECTDVCARIDCIKQMGLNGAEISITDLGSVLWNGTYFIRSFGWKHVQECPDWYDWILELEDTRHAEVGDGYD